MKLNSLLLAGAALVTATGAQAQSYPTYVGSWEVSDGPNWQTMPVSYTGQEAAAALFGGKASDYVISTISDDPTTINDSAWYSVLGASDPINGGFQFAQDYVSANSSQAPGYYYSGNEFRFGDPTESASAYVSDNAGSGNVNYAFRVAAATGAVPEPATWAMMLLGFGMIGGGVRYRRKQPVRVAFA